MPGLPDGGKPWCNTNKIQKKLMTMMTCSRFHETLGLTKMGPDVYTLAASFSKAKRNLQEDYKKVDFFFQYFL